MTKNEMPGVSNAKQALEQYYNDMLGSLEKDTTLAVLSNSNPSSNSVSNNNSAFKVDESKSLEPKSTVLRNKKVVSRPKLKPKRIDNAVKNRPFDEPTGLLSSKLILSQTFPCLTPVKFKTIKQAPTEALKPELNSVTALATLEAKKSLMTTEQRERFEQKILKRNATTKTQVALGKKQILDVRERANESAPVNKPMLRVEAKVTEFQLPPNEHLPLAAQPSIKKVTSPEPWLENGRPSWGQDRFECLLFSVSGLKLAVPLISLGAIYQIDKEFTPLVGRANWFMGLFRHLDRNVHVVDTAKWVMPERTLEMDHSDYEYVIRLGGNDWGLACNQVHQAFQLEPDQVKWRTDRTQRAWLSGTVIDHMCALLDVEALSYMLFNEATKQPSLFS